jgi:hypothetical protein
MASILHLCRAGNVKPFSPPGPLAGQRRKGQQGDGRKSFRSQSQAGEHPTTEELKTYLIALRLRRVTYEDAYIAVPVTDAIMEMKDDGTSSINIEAFTAEAIRIGGDDRVEWKIEEMQIETHPIQMPLPEGRSCFESFLLVACG